jgi:hypothetical protein
VSDFSIVKKVDASSPVRLLVHVSLDREGRATVGGFAALPSEGHLRPRVLQARGGTAQCADLDRDGRAGLARVEITFVDARSREAVVAIITPDDGDISAPGAFGGRIFFPDLDVSAPVTLVLRQAPSGHPG